MAKTGPAKTGPAGPLATAMQSGMPLVLTTDPFPFAKGCVAIHSKGN